LEFGTGGMRGVICWKTRINKYTLEKYAGISDYMKNLSGEELAGLLMIAVTTATYFGSR
jgi:hypothetical protein